MKFRGEDRMANLTPPPAIQVVGDAIWFDGQLMATIDVPEGTLRTQFVELIDEKRWPGDLGHVEEYDDDEQ